MKQLNSEVIQYIIKSEINSTGRPEWNQHILFCFAKVNWGNMIMKKAYALSQENESGGQVGYMSSLGPTSFWLYGPRKVTYILESNFSHLYGDIDFIIVLLYVPIFCENWMKMWKL